MTAEKKFLLLAAIESLPEIQANLIVLHYLQNQPLKDVAVTLQLSHSEVAIHHHTALLAMRRWSQQSDGI